MEREKGCAEQREHLERHIRLQPRRRQSLGEPGPLEGGRAEYVRPGPGKIVPVADRRTQMVRHGLAEHEARCVVMTIRKRIFAGRPFILDRRDGAEKSRPHFFLPISRLPFARPGPALSTEPAGEPPDNRASNGDLPGSRTRPPALAPDSLAVIKFALLKLEVLPISCRRAMNPPRGAGHGLRRGI